uniref:Nucleolar protein 58-like n=1 Tax=Nicotiana sylvestris TaxID=4096 RepID=A0A1U7VHB5_NICSY|nr:PREDICTED: nucleolar protein 58-like [Nicotiana sylvestris]
MRSLSEEENDESEEDYDNIYVASFIAARSRKETPKDPTLKRPTTRLQKKEALESVLKKNKDEKKKRRLVKGGKLENEEPSSVIHKSSKKPAVPKLRRETSMKNVEVEESGERVSEKYGEKVSRKSGENGLEKSSEKLSRKSIEKGKSVRKYVKGKGSVNKEPGSSKKAKEWDTPTD